MNENHHGSRTCSVHTCARERGLSLDYIRSSTEEEPHGREYAGHPKGGSRRGLGGAVELFWKIKEAGGGVWRKFLGTEGVVGRRADPNAS